jgi:hypothetical protein
VDIAYADRKEHHECEWSIRNGMLWFGRYGDQRFHTSFDGAVLVLHGDRVPGVYPETLLRCKRIRAMAAKQNTEPPAGADPAGPGPAQP